ncbi:MAG: DUF899 family protein, partial [Actinomycetota bacterium]
GCSAYTDNTDTVPGRIDLHRRETSYVTLSDMPLAQIAAYKKRKGWTVPFYSSHGTTFSDDCGAGRGFGLSVFLRDGGDIYQTYFTTGRGVDRLRFDMNIFDLTPLGRPEEWEETPGHWPHTEAQFAVTRKDRPADGGEMGRG